MTDLTGTSWLFNEVLDMGNMLNPQPSSDMLYVNFISNNTEYQSLYSDSNDLYYDYNILATQINVYSALFQSWTNQAYRTIEITGGTDATNATLISWLQANATQLVSAPTIAEQLITLNGVKQDIKAAIAAKHVAMDGVPFTNYPAKVDEISTGIDSEAAYAALIAATYPTGGAV